jgi:ATP-dependent RNA helicase RhlE
LKFTEFNFDPRIMEGIVSLGFEDTTPVQAQAMPLILQGRDVVADNGRDRITGL